MSSLHLRGLKPAVGKDQAPLTRTPKAPAHLSTFAKAEWRRVVPVLVARQILAEIDLAQVEVYCMMVGKVRQIEQECQLAGGLIDPKLFRVQNSAAQTARQLAATLGLDPVSRARLAATAPVDDDDDNPLAV